MSTAVVTVVPPPPPPPPSQLAKTGRGNTYDDPEEVLVDTKRNEHVDADLTMPVLRSPFG
jgi:hypothetical protein